MTIEEGITKLANTVYDLYSELSQEAQNQPEVIEALDQLKEVFNNSYSHHRFWTEVDGLNSARKSFNILANIYWQDITK